MEETRYDETKYVRSKKSIEMDVRSAEKKLEAVGVLSSSESFRPHEIDVLVETITQ